MSSDQDLLTLFNQSEYYALKYKNYFPIYEKLFSKFKGKKITFIEIGVLSGGSLFMWRKFFGDQARIIGIELNPAAKRFEKDGFEIHIGNQSDENFWKDFFQKVGEVDIILDDGGHTNFQQILQQIQIQTFFTTACISLVVRIRARTELLQEFGSNFRRRTSFHQFDPN